MYASGGDIIHVGGTTYAHIFTGNGTFTVTSGSLNTYILCIGGGGRGGSDSTTGGNGGGGAGAYGVVIDQQLNAASTYDIVIGAGATTNQKGRASYILQNNTSVLLYAGGGGSATINNNTIDGTNGSELTYQAFTIDHKRFSMGYGAGAGATSGQSSNAGNGGQIFLGGSNGNGGTNITGPAGGGGGGVSHSGYSNNDIFGGDGGPGRTIVELGINPGDPLTHAAFNNFPDIPEYTQGNLPYCCGGGGGGTTADGDPSFSDGGGSGGNGVNGNDADGIGSGGGGGGFAGGSSLQGGNGSNGLIIIYYTGDICLVEGTEVETDQGLVEIQLIKPGFHTIGGKRIVAITKSGGTHDCLVKVSKSAISENVPNKDTIMTRCHKVHHGNRLRESWRLPNTSKYPYSGQVLYNVLMETYQTMRVNNMTVETLHPNNEIAKQYIKN
jgi:hypothetical protein